jgi:hypothetical protein
MEAWKKENEASSKIKERRYRARRKEYNPMLYTLSGGL